MSNDRILRSMEASIDEERREVLALLEGPRPGPGHLSPYRTSSPTPMSPRASTSAASPSFAAASTASHSGARIPSVATGLPPVRSMLDIDSPPPPPQVIRSMLDIGGDAPGPRGGKAASTSTGAGLAKTISSPASPADNLRLPKASQAGHPRSMSDVGIPPADFGARSSASASSGPANDFTSGYQFTDIITNTTGYALPKRVSQGPGFKQALGLSSMGHGSSMASILRTGADRARHSIAGPSQSSSTNKSKSPSTARFPGLRSTSPQNVFAGRTLSPAGARFVAESEGFDMSHAYRRLSDGALALSGGSLSKLPLPGPKKLDKSGERIRLNKDYIGPNGEVLVEDSSDDNKGASSSDEEGERGRKTSRTFGRPGAPKAGGGGGATAAGAESSQSQRKAQSLLAAAEQERLQVAAKQPAYQYRSLLDDAEPKAATPLSTANMRALTEQYKGKQGVHPETSFDHGVDSDTEAEITDIKRAQKLSFAMTQIISTPEAHRTIQIIYRGDYATIVQEAEEFGQQTRRYLVATDLSDESTHALEWAIGTVLRDGDTLIAIYCVDEETGVVPAGDNMVPDDEKAMREQAAVINAATSTATSAARGAFASAGAVLFPLQTRGSPRARAADMTAQSRQPSASPGPTAAAAAAAAAASQTDSNGSSGNDGGGNGNSNNNSNSSANTTRKKTEEERYRAVQHITERVTKLLRKTRLQVRVMVEVLHCKNPRHLITEVIDLINPTLVVIGSRGRSALKGVILGSFSNYLVTKSSVPVMVARKRLRKHGKFKRPATFNQVNNITTPPVGRTLSMAKVD